MIVRKKRIDDELFHHGIKNQHWGVRNGPPYPLDSKTSSRIKKGHNEKLRDNKRVGISHYGSTLGRSWRYPSGMTFEEAKAQGDKYKDKEHEIKETITYEDRDHNVHNTPVLEFEPIKNFFDNNMEYTTENFNLNLSIHPSQKKEIRENGFSRTRLLGDINMDEPTDEYGSTRNNCSKCSDMVELVMRGLNPSLFSAGRSQYGMLNSANEYHWDGAIPYKEKSLANIENRINKFGNHGSGIISIKRSDGSGHAMHFSRLKDGSVEVQDAQIGKIYHSIRDALEAEGHDYNQFCTITRLDCATPNTKHMSEDSVIRVDSDNSYNVRFQDNFANKMSETTGSSPIAMRGTMTYKDKIYENRKNSGFTTWDKKEG